MTLPDFSHHYSTLFATIRQEKRNAKARTAGYRVEKSTLEEESGYTLVEDTPAQPGGFGNTQTPLQLHAKALQNARKGEGATSVPPEGETRLEAILDDFAEKLADEMLDEMAGAAAAEVGGDDEALANSGTSEGAEKGWETRRRNGWTPKQVEDNRATISQLISDLDKRGPNNSKAWRNETKDLGAISESLVADIRAANPKMRAAAGTMQTIDHDQLNHALEEHGEGKEKWANSIPITKEDLKKIPDVLSSYDEIRQTSGTNGRRKQEAVVFRKKYDDGTICCVEIDWFSRKQSRPELKFQTMWKLKAGEK